MHRVEERPQIGPWRVGAQAGRARPRVRVQHRKVELLLVRVEIDEQIVDFVEHFLRPGVRPIDLVDDDDRRQPALEGLSQHETCLRQRTLRRVHEQHDAVDHRQRPLHLAAEVRVPGRVDDVDEGVLIVNRGVLRENRDSALTLQLVAVHGAFGDAFVGPERTALMEQRIDERGLSVIDVGDDGDVTA